MIKEFVGTGRTIEEATLSAKAGLNAPLTADVKIEIVSMPKKKILGLFGGADARVKASYDDGKREKKPHQPKKEAPKKSTVKSVSPKTEEKAHRAAPPVKEEPANRPQEEKITQADVDLDYACKYLKTMIDSFRVGDADVTAKVVDGVVEMEVSCEDYGIIIGRRGETLDALQYLTGLAIKNTTNKYVRVTLNVGNYREKREETLKSLAVKNAGFVARSGRRYTFEPMNPYERRIIHTAVQTVEGVTSRSVGSGTERKVVIEPEGGVRRPSYSRGAGRKSFGRSSVQTPDPNREKRVDRADVPKFGKIEVKKDL